MPSTQLSILSFPPKTAVNPTPTTTPAETPSLDIVIPPDKVPIFRSMTKVLSNLGFLGNLSITPQGIDIDGMDAWDNHCHLRLEPSFFTGKLPAWPASREADPDRWAFQRRRKSRYAALLVNSALVKPKKRSLVIRPVREAKWQVQDDMDVIEIPEKEYPINNFTPIAQGVSLHLPTSFWTEEILAPFGSYDFVQFVADGAILRLSGSIGDYLDYAYEVPFSALGITPVVIPPFQVPYKFVKLLLALKSYSTNLIFTFARDRPTAQLTFSINAKNGMNLGSFEITTCDYPELSRKVDVHEQKIQEELAAERVKEEERKTIYEAEQARKQAIHEHLIALISPAWETMTRAILYEEYSRQAMADGWWVQMNKNWSKTRMVRTIAEVLVHDVYGCITADARLIEELAGSI